MSEYSEDPETAILEKNEHYEAEKQTLLVDMPPNLVPVYNELCM